MDHQVAIIPGLEREAARQPGECPAFFISGIKSKYHHEPILAADRGNDKSFPRLIGVRPEVGPGSPMMALLVGGRGHLRPLPGLPQAERTRAHSLPVLTRSGIAPDSLELRSHTHTPEIVDLEQLDRGAADRGAAHDARSIQEKMLAPFITPGME